MSEIFFIRCLTILLIISAGMLAVLSRKHFSKYKELPLIKRLRKKLSAYIRKCGAYNKAELWERTDKFTADLTVKLATGLMVTGIMFFGISFFINNSGTRDQSFDRPAAGNGPVNIKLLAGENGEELSLDIYPREFTNEEFLTAAGEAAEGLEKVICKDGDLQHITENLNLPSEAAGGALSIKWVSENTDIVGSSGRISRDELTEDTRVRLTATISDENYSMDYEIEITVLSYLSDMTISDRITRKLRELESETRTESTFTLPEQIDGERVYAESTGAGRLAMLLIVSLIIVVAVSIAAVERLKETGEKRDRILDDEYYGFVNRLTLMLGAGATMRNALLIAGEACREELAREIIFCINRIDSGIPENTAYTEMGLNTGRQEYMRLMSMISQNISHGNSRLIMLMNQECENSVNMKKEYVRKKSEEASEKLLLPTGILLMVVMGIIVIPALQGFS